MTYIFPSYSTRISPTENIIVNKINKLTLEINSTPSVYRFSLKGFFAKPKEQTTVYRTYFIVVVITIQYIVLVVSFFTYTHSFTHSAHTHAQWLKSAISHHPVSQLYVMYPSTPSQAPFNFHEILTIFIHYEFCFRSPLSPAQRIHFKKLITSFFCELVNSFFYLTSFSVKFQQTNDVGCASLLYFFFSFFAFFVMKTQLVGFCWMEIVCRRPRLLSICSLWSFALQEFCVCELVSLTHKSPANCNVTDKDSLILSRSSLPLC